MKKIVSVLCAAAVAVVMLLGCADGQTFSENTYDYDCEAITGVFVEVIDREVEVCLSYDDKISISCHESEKESYDIRVTDSGELRVEYAANKQWHDFIGTKPSAEYRRISIELPTDVLSDLSISTTNEKIKVIGLSVTRDISLASNGGDIEIDGINAGNAISLTAKNGDIFGSIVGGYDIFDIDCTVKKGECNLPRDKNGGIKTLAVDCNNGDVSILFRNSYFA
ncbi:MAG: DUF4097 family beta strand repeat-containing protein [Clostridia bacterium]|nr:DUF4097 family beta strand repeat-containing protein [Clostridia bacterium]